MNNNVLGLTQGLVDCLIDSTAKANLSSQSLDSANKIEDRIAGFLIRAVWGRSNDSPNADQEAHRFFRPVDIAHVKKQIASDIFSKDLATKTDIIITTFAAEWERFKSSCESFLASEQSRFPVARIEAYVFAYQKMLVELGSLISTPGNEDLLISIEGPSITESILHLGCQLGKPGNGAAQGQHIVASFLFPQLMEAVLRVCFDCSATVNSEGYAASEYGSVSRYLDTIATVSLALKNFSLRTFFNKKVYQFSLREIDGCVQFLGAPAGRQNSCMYIPPIRLLEKLWYLIQECRNNELTTLRVHMVGDVRESDLMELSNLLVAMLSKSVNELDNPPIASDTQNFEIHYLVYDNKDVSSGFKSLINEQNIKSGKEDCLSVSFKYNSEQAINLKKPADTKKLFRDVLYSNGSEGVEYNAYFILDPGSLYILKKTQNWNTASILDELSNSYAYDYGKTNSTVENGKYAKSSFQRLVRFVTRYCSERCFDEDIYNCTVNTELIGKFKAVFSNSPNNGEANKSSCYIYFSHSEALDNTELCDLNICRLENYNGHSVGVIRLSGNQKLLPLSSDNKVISLCLWQILKSFNSNACALFLNYCTDSADAKPFRYFAEKASRPLDDFKLSKQAALVLILKNVFLGIEYKSFGEYSKPLDFFVTCSKKELQSFFRESATEEDLSAFVRLIEELVLSMLAWMISPSTYAREPIGAFHRDALKKALYGRAQTVDEALIYYLYDSQPGWLLDGARTVNSLNIVVAETRDSMDGKRFEELKKLYNSSSFQHFDKRFYIFNMVVGDLGPLTAFDSQKREIIQLTNETWYDYNTPASARDVFRNIKKSCENLGYTDSALYSNYERY